MEQSNNNASEQNNSTIPETQNPQSNAHESFGDNYSTLESSAKIPHQHYYDSSPRNYRQEDMAPPMRIWDWVVTLGVAMIPVVGMVMLFIWAFSEETNRNRRNFCRARIIAIAIWTTSFSLFSRLFWGIILAILSAQDSAMLF